MREICFLGHLFEQIVEGAAVDTVPQFLIIERYRTGIQTFKYLELQIRIGLAFEGNGSKLEIANRVLQSLGKLPVFLAVELGENLQSSEFEFRTVRERAVKKREKGSET